jgi:nitroreductase
MDLIDAIRTNPTTREFKPDPVPDEVLARVLDAARFAPTGGNRQPVRFVVVREPETKRRLRDLYLPHWKAYIGAISPEKKAADPKLARLVERADRFAETLDRVPVMLVVCAELANIFPTDAKLGRLSIVGGGSVYPAVQNLLLACRAEGLGSALTTLLCFEEPKVKPLLGIPEGIATAAMIPIGWPVKPFPKRLGRRPLAESVFLERWGEAFPAAAAIG